MQTTENDAAKLAARSYREGFNAMKLKALELLGNTCLHCENADLEPSELCAANGAVAALKTRMLEAISPLSPFQARRLSVDVLDLDDFARDILGRETFFGDAEDDDEDDEENNEEDAEDEEPQDVKRGAAR
ncbi:MAG: hypothetical protein IKU86_01830 [Thermoguttaceae bacterium]|nr:hypothetical protein [Thermoguttaceae bacterium]